MTTFLDGTSQLPYCPGCGHPHVLRALDAALEATGLEPSRFVLVTDIGCVGLADAYFPTLHTVHSLHGRAAALGTGMSLGEPKGDGRAPLKPVVLVGDGGSTIGLLHLVHGAQVDADVTVIVHNNLIYGMTGGQHSGLTPEGFRTTTTPDGNPVPPLDLGRVLEGAGCSFFARVRAPGDDLVETLTQAIRHPGFALVEALELCPTFAARVGGMTGKGLTEYVEAQGLRMGIVRRERTRHETPAELVDRDPLGKNVRVAANRCRLDRTVRMVVAGKAGERIQSAAKLAAAAATAAGLHVTVRTDNPVTQGRGFSLAEVTISPDRIDYTGLVDPDLVIATADEGYGELKRRGTLEGEDTGAAERIDLRKRFGPKAAALGAVVEAIVAAGWWTEDAWREAVAALADAPRADALKTLAKAGLDLGPGEDPQP